MEQNSKQQIHPLQYQFEQQVKSGNVAPETSWGKKVNAYNIHIRFSEHEQLQLERLQAKIEASTSEALLKIPREAIHISALWIVAALVDYGAPRDYVWKTNSNECLKIFNSIVPTLPAFTVYFSHLVITPSAVILVGQDDGQMASLRQTLKSSLPLPHQTNNNQEIIHTTLFRFKEKLKEPLKFWDLVHEQMLKVSTRVQELEIRREVTYPSLESELVCKIALQA
jgi:hypothetical protein